MRGAPGSGKSSKAKHLTKTLTAKILSTDDFFESDQGYCYKTLQNLPTLDQLKDIHFMNLNKTFLGLMYCEILAHQRLPIQVAHQWNILRALSNLETGNSIIIDNTNMAAWQCVPYINLGKVYQTTIFQYVCDGEFTNTHDVPEEIVQKFRYSFEVLENVDHLTEESVWAEKKLIKLIEEKEKQKL